MRDIIITVRDRPIVEYESLNDLRRWIEHNCPRQTIEGWNMAWERARREGRFKHVINTHSVSFP